MKTLVLGSSGQIGSELVDYLREHGDKVLEFDIVNSEKQDLRINNILNDLMKDIDFVYFLAFDVGGSRYLKEYQNTYDFVDNNMKLMVNTFETLKKYNKPFIFASSQMSNMSYSSYGILKRIGEEYTKILNGIVVKFWNVYGYEEDLDKAHVITDFILSAKAKKEINMLTDGTEVRQMLYARDCSECLRILAENFNDIDRTKDLHITSFKWDSILDIANIIADYYKANVNPAKSKDEVQKDKRNEPNKFILKYWKPNTTLKEGIYKIIKKYEGE